MGSHGQAAACKRGGHATTGLAWLWTAPHRCLPPSTTPLPSSMPPPNPHRPVQYTMEHAVSRSHNPRACCRSCATRHGALWRSRVTEQVSCARNKGWMRSALGSPIPSPAITRATSITRSSNWHQHRRFCLRRSHGELIETC